ncbi:DUF413 domain-containing protein [Niveispirillum fermenti]|uniref:DUF413 domain-containing protein n=1 Tax=Niveispirillum fermenti TaxID=1233113 RepID=UPI003A844E9D
MDAPILPPQGELTPQEEALLRRYRSFYQGLVSGARPPTTAAQRHFIAACRGLTVAETPHERAFIKARQLAAAEDLNMRAAQETAGQDIPNEPGTYTYPSHVSDKFDIEYFPPESAF